MSRPTVKPISTTDAKAQEEYIIKHIQTYGRLSTLQGRELGIFNLAARIYSLRKQGWNIVTNRMDETDSVGVLHKGVGVYTIDGGKHE